jgi:hypothetical protein
MTDEIEGLYPSRRQMIQSFGGGFGAIGLASLLAPESAGATSEIPNPPSPIRHPRGPHFRPRAKRIIHLFMNGGPFQCDFFDPKPSLNKYAGQRPKEVQLRTERPTAGLMPVPFNFNRCGRSGLEMSELLPHLSDCADELCVLRSLHTDNPNHGPALFMMNSGIITPTRPSLGAWLSYGLGTENADLPGFVVLCPGRPVRFSELWSSGFLPAEHQGTYVNHTSLDPVKMFPYLKGAAPAPAQRRQLDLMRRLNEEHLAARGPDAALDARIKAMETAFRMQTVAGDAFDLRREPARVRAEYGDGHFADGCLLARRLAERGVRFVQVYYGDGQPWDTHNKHTEKVRKLAKDIDQPIAALLTDLKRRGLLDDTLVVWGGEFGRTPTSENGDGRDHNHWGFTMWLAGGGVKGGLSYGASDDFGFRAAVDKVHVHDLHATLLHLLGFDHE